MMAVPQQFRAVLCLRVSSVMHALSDRGGGLADCGNILLLAQLCLNQSGFYGSVCAVYVPHMFLD